MAIDGRNHQIRRELIGDILGTQFDTTSTETEIELNLAMVKIKHTVKREKKDDDK